ncbi:MAG: DUF1566 domain-containing protein [Bacteroidales bacterium]|nr:DUF1566 domain-containing protein [Bacteroidales bacterium]
MKKNQKNLQKFGLTFVCLFVITNIYSQTTSYPIVDTGEIDFYDNSSIISAPTKSSAFYGQDATYAGNQPSYTDNGDGTVTDNVTGLMWQKEMGTKINYKSAFTKADTLTLGGYSDWRVPTIKELYSLILFTGSVRGAVAIDKFIDTNYFNQPLGDTSIGEREIDAQTWSSTQYKGVTMYNDSTIFGVNFIDGRIKGYPKYQPGSGNTIPKSMYFRMVRGNKDYGKNNFIENNDGTISDFATGLMWQKADDGQTRNWENALSYAEGLELAGHSDWRLPNAKELQSIVDYNRSPSYTQSPAIDPIFSTSSMVDPDGVAGQYPYFWTSTSHLDGVNPYNSAVYIAFGKAQGQMSGTLLDVHGAGAQRSDPKSGTASDYPTYFGPQGDVRYVYNAVRCVRNISSANSVTTNKLQNEPTISIDSTSGNCYISLHKSFQKIQIDVFDSVGKSLKQAHSSNADKFYFNLSAYQKGIYIVILTLDNSITSRKIVW